MVNVVAQSCNKQGQLVQPGQTPGGFGGHEDEVHGVQNMHHMLEVVVGIISVMSHHSGDPDHEGPLLNPEVAQDAGIHEDVKDYYHLQEGGQSFPTPSIVAL